MGGYPQKFVHENFHLKLQIFGNPRNLESSVKQMTSFAKFYQATKDNLLYI